MRPPEQASRFDLRGDRPVATADPVCARGLLQAGSVVDWSMQGRGIRAARSSPVGARKTGWRVARNRKAGYPYFSNTHFGVFSGRNGGAPPPHQAGPTSSIA